MSRRQCGSLGNIIEVHMMSGSHVLLKWYSVNVIFYLYTIIECHAWNDWALLQHSVFEGTLSNRSALPTDWEATILTVPPTITESRSHSRACVVSVIWATPASWTLPSRYGKQTTNTTTSIRRKSIAMFWVWMFTSSTFLLPVPEQCIPTHRILPRRPLRGRD